MTVSELDPIEWKVEDKHHAWWDFQEDLVT